MFRFVGLSFLLPDAVSPAPPHSFAFHAAYGDLAATIRAMITTLFGVGLAPGVVGPAVYIPIVVVPPLLIAHAMMFRLLLRGENH